MQGQIQITHINQTERTPTWKETCTEFKRYRQCSLSSSIYEICWDFRSAKTISLPEKKNVVGIILVAITDSSDVCCFDLYLISIFTKSTKSERSTDIMFKLTLCLFVTAENLYCLSVTIEDLNSSWKYRYEDINILGTCYFVLLDDTLGARQAHARVVRLIFPVLILYQQKQYSHLWTTYRT